MTRSKLKTALALLALQIVLAPAALAQCIPVNFPAGWLHQQENAGGHTIARHGHKADAELVQRLQQHPNIAAASTYTNDATAEAFITAGLGVLRVQLNQWAANAQVGAQRANDFVGNNTVGRVAFRPPNLQNIVNSTLFRTVLRATGQGECFLLTSFPTRPPQQAADALNPTNTAATTADSPTATPMDKSNPQWTSLLGYLAGNFSDTDLSDEKAAVDGLNKNTVKWYKEVLQQGRGVLKESFDWQQIPDYANRTFDTKDKALVWLEKMMDTLEFGIKSLG
jgi:hypothetical protein